MPYVKASSTCPDPVYTAELNGGGAIPTFFTNFDDTSLTFDLDPILNIEAGDYDIDVIATWADGTTFTLTHTVTLTPCVATAVTTLVDMEDHVFQA